MSESVDWRGAPIRDTGVCPNCGCLNFPPPSRKRACDECGQVYYVRRCPDGARRIVTWRMMVELECVWAEESAVSTGSVMTLSVSREDADRQRGEAHALLRRAARERVLFKHGLNRDGSRPG